MSQLVQEKTAVGNRSWRDDWPVAVTAAGAAAGVWVLATQVAGADLAVRAGSGTQQVGLVSVVVTSLVVSVAGSALLRLLQRRTPRGTAIWTAIAASVWVVSFTGPLGARSAAAGLWLVALHLVVGAVVLFGLRSRRAA